MCAKFSKSIQFLTNFTIGMTGNETGHLFECVELYGKLINKGALAIRRIFSLVDMITKPKFSNCPNVFKIGLFR